VPIHPNSSTVQQDREACGRRSGARRVVLGSEDADHVSITVLGRLHPDTADYWDCNWVDALILVCVGGFTARVGAGLRVDEIHRYAEGLNAVYQNLNGIAVLSTVEHWIDLSVKCERSGVLAGMTLARPASSTGDSSTSSARTQSSSGHDRLTARPRLDQTQRGPAMTGRLDEEGFGGSVRMA
jgi:hypothetical protein